MNQNKTMKNIKVNKLIILWIILGFPGSFFCQNFDIESFHQELTENVNRIVKPRNQDDIFIIYFEIMERNDSLRISVFQNDFINYLDKEFILSKIRTDADGNKYPINKYIYKLVYDGVENKVYLEVYSK